MERLVSCNECQSCGVRSLVHLVGPPMVHRSEARVLTNSDLATAVELMEENIHWPNNCEGG